MYEIFKLTSASPVDFAAEELQKYLRMMMPRCGAIPIRYDPHAVRGFRLGLLEDFGLTAPEAEDARLDDVIHLQADENGQIIAGSNPRSVLLAVYRFLKLNGCRWLFPGVDGEFIPLREARPQNYHKMADLRYRGQCNEGATAQRHYLDVIDYLPKLGMNVFMLEFDVPAFYYDLYYQHAANPHLAPEPVTHDTILQWKRQCECEIQKRGLQYHDMGHGWTVDPFGLHSDGWDVKEIVIPDDVKPFIAEVGGTVLFGRDYKNKRRLTITCAHQRMLYGRTTVSRPSRFLAEIPEELVERKQHTQPRFVQQAKPRPRPTMPHSDTLGSHHASGPVIDFRKGDTVEHDVFGRGLVLSVLPTGNDKMLEIAFDQIGTKRLMANFAASRMRKL